VNRRRAKPLPLAAPLAALALTAFALARAALAAGPPLESRDDALARLDSLQSIVRLEEARVRKTPGSEEAWDRLARAWFQVGDEEKAARCMDRAQAMGAKTFDTQLLSGRVARAEGRFDDAVRWLDAAVRLQPDDWEANEDLGVALYLAGHYREAAERWDRSRALPQSGAPDRSGLTAALRRLRVPAYAITGRGRERLRFAAINVRGAIAVPVRIQGRGPFLVRIDLGTPETVLGRSLASELGLAIDAGGETGTFVGDRPVRLDYAVVDSIALGATTIHDLPVAVSDEPARGGPGAAIRGTLGFEVLRRFRFAVDFPDSTLILEPAGPPIAATPPSLHPGAPRPRATPPDTTAPAWLPAGSAAHRLPLVIRGTHLLVVPVRLGQAPERPFVLDTGSPGSAVAAPMSTLAEAGIVVDTTRVLNGTSAAGAVSYFAFDVPRVCAGTACRDALTGTYGLFPARLELNPNFRIAGLLSRGFLDRYRVAVDLGRREVWLIEP
jgi:hypothetical protein